MLIREVAGNKCQWMHMKMLSLSRIMMMDRFIDIEADRGVRKDDVRPLW